MFQQKNVTLNNKNTAGTNGLFSNFPRIESLHRH
jgi:hypothetical protein